VWIKQQIEMARQRDESLPAHLCYRQLRSRGQISNEDLLPIILGARATAEVEWSPAMDYLFDLAAKHEAARWALSGLFGSRNLMDRLKVVSSIPSSAPPSVSQPLLAAALHDKSTRIREKAGWTCLQVGGQGVVDLLNARVAVEKDPSTFDCLRRYRDLLKDGHHIEDRGNGTFELAVLTKARGIASRRISAADRNDPQRLRDLIREASG
jgi:hypothetical protein